MLGVEKSVEVVKNQAFKTIQCNLFRLFFLVVLAMTTMWLKFTQIL